MGQAVLDRYPHSSPVLFFISPLIVIRGHPTGGRNKLYFKQNPQETTGFMHIRIPLSALCVSSHRAHCQIYLPV